MKLDIESIVTIIRDTLAAQKVAAKVIDATVKEVLKLGKETVQQEQEAKGEAELRLRKEFAALFFDDPKEGVTQGHIFQLDPDVPAHTLPERISKVAAIYHATKKGRKKPAKNLTEAIELPPAKLFKEERIVRKTKEKIYILQAEDKLV